MKKIIMLAIAIGLLINGCTMLVYDKEGMTREQLLKDKEECKREPHNGLPGDITDCMRARGYNFIAK